MSAEEEEERRTYALHSVSYTSRKASHVRLHEKDAAFHASLRFVQIMKAFSHLFAAHLGASRRGLQDQRGVRSWMMIFSVNRNINMAVVRAMLNNAIMFTSSFSCN